MVPAIRTEVLTMFERDAELERLGRAARELDPQQLAPIVDLAEYIAKRGALAREFLAMIDAALAGAQSEAHTDPMAGLPDWAVHAPLDDEPLSDEAMARIAEAVSEMAAGNVSPGDEVFRRLLG
jgi:hypothetical protein